MQRYSLVPFLQNLFAGSCKKRYQVRVYQQQKMDIFYIFVKVARDTPKYLEDSHEENYRYRKNTH